MKHTWTFLFSGHDEQGEYRFWQCENCEGMSVTTGDNMPTEEAVSYGFESGKFTCNEMICYRILSE